MYMVAFPFLKSTNPAMGRGVVSVLHSEVMADLKAFRQSVRKVLDADQSELASVVKRELNVEAETAFLVMTSSSIRAARSLKAQKAQRPAKSKSGLKARLVYNR